MRRKSEEGRKGEDVTIERMDKRDGNNTNMGERDKNLKEINNNCSCAKQPQLGKDLETNNEYSRYYAIGKSTNGRF
jgi:hypothetical protein